MDHSSITHLKYVGLEFNIISMMNSTTLDQVPCMHWCLKSCLTSNLKLTGRKWSDINS